MHKLFTFLLVLVFSSSVFSSPIHKGLISVKSPYNVSTTANRLESILKNKGMTVFLRIDHAKTAKKFGEEIRPTELIVFGNPKVGSKLMHCAQTIGIDLPLKALIIEDENGQVWLSFNDPQYLANRHQFECNTVLNTISKALDTFAESAISHP